MPYTKGTATNLDDLVAQIVAWSTDTAIHGEDAWKLMRSEPWPRGTIIKAKGLNGINNCYIGLMVLKFVKGATYREWLLQTKNLARYLVWHKNGLNLKGAAFTHANGSPAFTISSSQRTYTLHDPDIVQANGSALVFGVFKQYAEDLDWHEQPGAIDVGELGQYPLQYSVSGSSSSQSIPPPVYPGLGYPGIGMPEGEPSGGYFHYWLTKDACRLTVVTKNLDQWDIGHAGMLIPFHSRMQYAWPAVVAGSCTGLKTASTFGAYRAVTTGSKIDYSYDNWSLSRSMPCFPAISANTAPKLPETSQLGVCTPNGTWKFFHNWVQNLKPNMTEYEAWFTLERPVRAGREDGYRVRPTDLDLNDIAPALAGDDTVSVEPIELYRRDADSGNTDMLGTLWRMAWPGIDGPYGEITVNGKACLILPNCWEDRMWYLPNGRNGVTDQVALYHLFKEITKYSKQFRMLVRLED